MSDNALISFSKKITGNFNSKFRVLKSTVAFCCQQKKKKPQLISFLLPHNKPR